MRLISNNSLEIYFVCWTYLIKLDATFHGALDISRTDITGGVTILSLDAPTETGCKSFIAGMVSLIGNSIYLGERLNGMIELCL